MWVIFKISTMLLDQNANAWAASLPPRCGSTIAVKLQAGASNRFSG